MPDVTKNHYDRKKVSVGVSNGVAAILELSHERYIRNMSLDLRGPGKVRVKRIQIQNG